MQNQFDFFSIQVSSPRISDLKKLGVDRSKIQSERNGWRVYGSGMYAKRFPIWSYVASVAFVDMAGKTPEIAGERVDTVVREWRDKVTAAGLACTVHPRYYARD